MHRPSTPHLSTPVICAGLLIPTLAVLTLVGAQPWIPVAYLVRDPLVVAEEAGECCSVYYGAVSNLGVMLWIATAAICLLLALQVRIAQAERGLEAFFLAGGLFSLWLGIDDFFLIHEDVLPVLGIAQPVAFAIYGSTALAYLGFAWRYILAGRISLFLLAGLCLGGSMGLDAVVHSEEDFWIFLEDATKFLGIVLWSGFHLTSALSATVRLVTGRVTTVALPQNRLVRSRVHQAA